MTTLQPLSKNTQIVNSDGTPTEYFMRILQDRGFLQANDHDRLGVLEKRKINTTAPLGGGGDLTADRTLVLEDSGVVPNTYGDATHVAQFTVDVHGLLTAAANVPITFASTLEVDNAGGLVQSNVTKLKFIGATVTAPVAGEADVTIAAGVPTTRIIASGTGLSGGGDLSADRTLSLANTSVTPGSYTVASITVDAQGRITSASSGSLSGYVQATRQVIAGAGLTGGGDLSSDRTFALTTTGVAPGSYTLASLTVDAYGRITAVASGSVPVEIWAPAATGDLPGPVLIADPFGQCMMVRIA